VELTSEDTTSTKTYQVGKYTVRVARQQTLSPMGVRYTKLEVTTSWTHRMFDLINIRRTVREVTVSELRPSGRLTCTYDAELTSELPDETGMAAGMIERTTPIVKLSLVCRPDGHSTVEMTTPDGRVETHEYKPDGATRTTVTTPALANRGNRSTNSGGQPPLDMSWLLDGLGDVLKRTTWTPDEEIRHWYA
jgi:hypothetical protein